MISSEDKQAKCYFIKARLVPERFKLFGWEILMLWRTKIVKDRVRVEGRLLSDNPITWIFTAKYGVDKVRNTVFVREKAKPVLEIVQKN